MSDAPATSRERILSSKGERIGTAAGIAALLAVTAWYLVHRGGASPVREEREVSLLVEYPSERMGVQPGDPRQGERLYRMHCTACHGLRGHGDGPAARYIYPGVRDHSDGVYMNSQRDADLHKAILLGGAAVDRSPLMPAWNDKFSALDAWDLVAYVRKLHPPLRDLFPDAGRAALTEAVLDAQAVARLQTALKGALTVREYASPFLAVSDGAGRPLGYYSSATLVLLGEEASLAAAISPEGRVLGLSLWPKWTIQHRDRQFPDRIEGFLRTFKGQAALDAGFAGETDPLAAFPEVRALIDRTARATILRLWAAVEQARDDVAEAESVRQLLATDPEAIPRAQRTFIKNCAPCHGLTGRAVGPGLDPNRTFTPRNLSNGAHLNPLEDAYLRSLILKGGLWARVSGAMPAFGSLQQEELEDLTGYVRSIASPRYVREGAAK